MSELPDVLAAVAADAAARVGYTGVPVRLRGRTNSVYRVGDLVVRVSDGAFKDVARSLTLANMVAELAPVCVGPRVVVPVVLGGHLATLWPYLGAVRPAEPLDGVLAARLLHEATSAADLRHLPLWEPGASLERAASTRSVTSLVHRARLLGPALVEAPEGLGAQVAVHHHIKTVNVLVTTDGVRLVDLDGLCRGPAILDLAIILPQAQRAGSLTAATRAYPALAALGADMLEHPSLRAAVLARRMDHAAWLLTHPVGRTDEIEHVLATLDADLPR